MPKTLTSLAIAAIDEFYALNQLQELIKICLDQLDRPDEQSLLRINLLLSSFLSEFDCHASELKFNLEKIRQLVVGEEAEQ